MARKRFRDMNCSTAQTLDRVGDWWTMLIVRDAFFGTKQFSDFHERLGIAKNILSDRLSSLVEDGIFKRVQTKPGSDRCVYELTEKGRDLLPVLVALMQWGDKWVYGRGREPMRLVDARDKKPIRPLQVTAADGRALAIEDLRGRAGPGADEETRAQLTPRRQED
jgi:DNA-binding HxlR family transcriptional regulator